MKAALHDNGFFTFNKSINKFPFMKFYSCCWEIGNLVVAHFINNLNLVYESPQT